MGSTPSTSVPKSVYLEINGRVRKVIFSQHSSPADVRDLVKSAGGLLGGAEMTLVDGSGSPVNICPEMPVNRESSPYKIIFTSPQPSGREMQMQTACSDIVLQLSRYLKMDDIEKDFSSKLTLLERRLQAESGRRVEMERCQREIENLHEELEKSPPWICVSPCPPLSRKLTPRRDIPSYAKYTLSPETIDALKTPTFDVWQWAPNEMLSCLEYMYHGLGLVRDFNINPIALKRWLLNVQENYKDNPFHNFRHSFSVTQMMHGMIYLCDLQERLAPIEIFILITSAICHDLDHPGLTNAYQINAATELWSKYGDRSPLEQHHCAVTVTILAEDECNILSGAAEGEVAEIHKGMRELILATDMDRHGAIMSDFAQCVEVFNFRNPEHVRLLEQVLIKCCDTSNEARPLQVSDPWVDCLLQEYFMQGDRERAAGLPVTPFMDRERVSKPLVQFTFITSVLIPMVESLSKLFPQLDEVLLSPLRATRDLYEQRGEGRHLLQPLPETPVIQISI